MLDGFFLHVLRVRGAVEFAAEEAEAECLVTEYHGGLGDGDDVDGDCARLSWAFCCEVVFGHYGGGIVSGGRVLYYHVVL